MINNDIYDYQVYIVPTQFLLSIILHNAFGFPPASGTSTHCFSVPFPNLCPSISLKLSTENQFSCSLFLLSLDIWYSPMKFIYIPHLRELILVCFFPSDWFNMILSRSSMLQQIAWLYLFLWPSSILFCICTIVSLSDHLFAGIWVSIFLANVYRVTMNIGVQTSFLYCALFIYLFCLLDIFSEVELLGHMEAQFLVFYFFPPERP